LVGPTAGSNTVSQFVIPSIATWTASTATPWLHLPATNGTGSGNVLFRYDANPGPTRTGTLTINGRTVTVTQAGSTYVKAPGPLTTLASAGLANPSELTVDIFGNVIFSDTGNNAVKNWSPISNTVTSIITSGLNTPEGVAVDAAGNIYLADFGSHLIKKRLASDGSVITLVDDSPNSPASVSLDSATNVYWTGPTDDSVKKWTAASGTVTTVLATNLNSPYGVAVDIAGNIFIADTFNNAVKKWNQVLNSLTTVGVSSNGVSTPWGVAVDGSGNVYVANGGTDSILKWVAASGTFVTVVPSGAVDNPTGVSVDSDQNLYIADFGNDLIKELPHAYVDGSAKFEPATAGTDSLGVILPPDQSLEAPFAPSVNQPWLSIASTAGGVVTFNYEANTNTAARAGFITVLGQNIFVQQDGIVLPPVFTGIELLTNGTFQVSFTNGLRGETYSVLFSTNLALPVLDWIVIGTVTNNGDVWQFTDTAASNDTRFYRIRSP
jgi:streptogramin lyase